MLLLLACVYRAISNVSLFDGLPSAEFYHL